MDELFKDRLARYSFLYAKRNTIKEKDRFLKALVTDIQQERNDIKVVEFNKSKKSASHNVYVGNIKTADSIICTYYDTPLSYWSNYVLFDREDQKKHTLRSIVVVTGLWLLFGFIFTLGCIRFVDVRLNFASISTWLLIFFYIIYFMIFSKLSKGNWNRKTLIRNTSSVLFLLQILSNKDKNVAYAFLDEGCYGEKGLEELNKSIKKHASIYCLDCIGANADIVVSGKCFSKRSLEKVRVEKIKNKNNIHYIFASDLEIDGKFALKKSTLENKTLNYENFKIIYEILKDCIKGE